MQTQSIIQKLGINIVLLYAKLEFLFYYGGMSCLLPFLSIYFKQIGLSGDEIGYLQALRQFVNFISAPLTTFIADQTKKHALVLILSILISSIIRFLMMYIGNSFLYLFLMTVIIEFFSSPSGSLINHATLDALGDKKDDYGKQRLYGAVGWGSFALIIGAIVTNTQNIDYCFWSFLVIMTISAVVACGLKQPSVLHEEASAPRQHATKQVIQLLTYNVESFLLYINAFIMGIASGIHFTYLFLFLQQLGGTELLMGLSLTVTCIAEIPFFFFAGTLLQKVGPRAVLYGSLSCYAIRLLWYSFLKNPWLVLPAELLHGVTFGAFWSASVSLASSNAPPGLRATAQGILSGLYDGLGNATGTLIGGFIYQRYGIAPLFFWTSIVLFVTVFIFGVFQVVRKFTSHRVEHKILEEEVEMKAEIDTAVGEPFTTVQLET